jgi:excisionase family DNA binding protein
MSNKSATNLEQHKKNCYTLHHVATRRYTVLHKGEMTMTASKYPYSKICVFCQEAFLARKSTTLYCSHKCGSRAYKENKRQEKILQSNATIKRDLTAPVIMLQAREVLSIEEVSLLLGISRWTVMRMYKTNKIRTITIGTRRLILREELDKILKTK